MATKDRGGRRPAGGSPRSARRQHLDETAVARICEVIRSWPESPLRWEDLVAVLRQRGIGSWTRQALSSKPAIIQAIQARKDALAKGVKRPRRDPEVVVLRRQVDDLRVRNEELLAKLAWYEERHLVMLRNASVRGLTEAELMKALPPIDRSKF
ncbi:hypothetical protein [Methylobacterium fujisawaense]|uniref:hypothetical protein n=1 Tax=Methylobacterium fujisawaense TaxID=107400 RepID=UPI00313DFF2A